MEIKIHLKEAELLDTVINEPKLRVYTLMNRFHIMIDSISKETGLDEYVGELSIDNESALFMAHSIIKMIELKNK